MHPRPIHTPAQQRILEYAAYLSYVSKLYAALAGNDGLDILKKLFPTSTINPTGGLMRPFCPETADVVHDFLRTGLIAPIDPSNGYKLNDAFVIASEDHLDLDHKKFFGDTTGNWIVPAHHSIEHIPLPTKKKLPSVPRVLSDAEINRMGNDAANQYINDRNKAVDEYNRINQENDTADLNYFKETIGGSSPSDVDDILNDIKSYLEANPIGGKYRMGHVVVHGIRDNKLNTVNRRDGKQHFFIIMLYEGDLYLVDAMLGFKVNTTTQTNPSTNQTYDVLDRDPVNAKGPTISKDLHLIRSYFRNEGFKNILFSKSFDAVRGASAKHGRKGSFTLGETDWGIPSFAKKRPNDYFDINNPLLLQPCALYGFTGM